MEHKYKGDDLVGEWKHARVRPSTASIDPHRVKTSFEQLHEFDSPIECLLLTRQRDDHVSYYFGTPGSRSQLIRILKSAFPDDFEFAEASLDLSEEFGNSDWLLGSESRPVAAEFLGEGQRQFDWQTRLQPIVREGGIHHLPLPDVAEILSSHPGSGLYQARFSPKPDWTVEADVRRIRLETNQDTFWQRWLTDGTRTRREGETRLKPTHSDRLEEIDAKDARSSFDVEVTILVTGTHSEETIDAIRSAFRPTNGRFYRVLPHVISDDLDPIIDQIASRSTRSRSLLGRVSSLLPFTAHRSPTIVTDPTTLPHFTIISGKDLDTSSDRALSSTPAEQTPLPRPPEGQLDTYRHRGLTLGHPLTNDGTVSSSSIALPPDLQPMHVAWFGKTGSGKSTAIINAILANHEATDGADILVDPKGDGMALEYLQAHYLTYGTLENVLYYDCASILPAFSFFDIRDELAAGISRTAAVEDVADHYVEILTQIMGRDRFEQAVRSPDIIRYLVKAMFDPVNDLDAFGHSNLHAAARSMHERQSPPPVTDPTLERMLAGVTANQKRSFDKLMQGVANRMEKIPRDDRLAKLFDHVPRRDDDPHLDLAEYIDENVVVLISTGGLRSEAQRVLTMVVLSNLWTALRRRRELESAERLPLVNLYVEEAASVAVSKLLNELLAQARSFDCSVTLAMQYPAQLRRRDPATYDEVLNNVSTFVTGNVPLDQRLAKRLAHEDMAPSEVGNRLRSLRRGQWLVKLPAEFDEPEPRPFLVRSVEQPPSLDGLAAGHEQTEGFESAFDEMASKTRDRAGLQIGGDAHERQEGEESKSESSIERTDSALPLTTRMPKPVEYDHSLHALECTECTSRYPPRIEGMRRAINCCSSVDDIDRDEIPICNIDLKLSAEEIQASDWSAHQLLFCQAVYNAQTKRYDTLEYDLLTDSMIRLEEYVGIESDQIARLVEAGLLRHDTDQPYRLYSVTSTGRSEIGESYRRGVDYGHGIGDLTESSQHILAVEVGRRYLETRYAADPDSSVVEIVPYYEVGDDDRILPLESVMGGASGDSPDLATDEDRFRLDVAGLDDEGVVRVALEAERINNDSRKAVPADYDKMARLELDEAIWIAMNRTGAHKILKALNDPSDGEPRVEKTYSQNTAPREFVIDQPGFTQMYTLDYLRSRLVE